nr:unnamed protein product [Spirometra erinaceieuropaei]
MTGRPASQHPTNAGVHADDYASNEAATQRSIDPFVFGCSNFGLTVNTDKIMVLHQSAPEEGHTTPNTSVNGARLASLDEFAYLHSSVFNNAKVDDRVVDQILNGSWAFSRLHVSA